MEDLNTTWMFSSISSASTMPLLITEKTTTDMGTKDVCVTTQEISLAVNTIAMIVGMLISLGNLTVLVVLFKYPENRFTPFNWLLCHLAVADLTVGLNIFWWFGLAEVLLIRVTLFQKVISYGISIMAVLASIEGLMMIAFDRYLLILQQKRYKDLLTRRRLSITIAAMWLLPAVTQIVAPASGWSCVEKCDCRIHNLSPDTTYCFGKECSQMVPPLTKHQLFMTSLSSLLLFFITLTFYILIFIGAREQTNKVKEASCQLISYSNANFTCSENEVKSSFKEEQNNSSGLRNTEICRRNSMTPERKKTNAFAGNTEPTLFSLNLVYADKGTNNNKMLLNADPMKKKTRLVSLESDDTNVDQKLCTEQVEQKVTSEDCMQSNKTSLSLDFESSCGPNNHPISSSLSLEENEVAHEHSNQSIPCAEAFYSNVTLKVLSSVTQHKRNSNIKSKSFPKDILNKHSAFQESKYRRKKANRKKELRLMRSMFIIMTVFVVTTSPLMIFIVHTFFNNNLDLKEIFSILLQVATLNSFLNPLLYFWRLPTMRKKFLKLVHANSWRNDLRMNCGWCR